MSKKIDELMERNELNIHFKNAITVINHVIETKKMKKVKANDRVEFTIKGGKIVVWYNSESALIIVYQGIKDVLYYSYNLIKEQPRMDKTQVRIGNNFEEVDVSEATIAKELNVKLKQLCLQMETEIREEYKKENERKEKIKKRDPLTALRKSNISQLYEDRKLELIKSLA